MKRLVVFDFDGTLFNSPEKESGKKIWKEKTGKDYPHVGWWGRKESLDTDVFDIKPFPNVLNKLEKEKDIPDTQVIILTSRMEKLRSEIEKILDNNNIIVDDVLLKKGGKGKGEVILKIADYNPDLEEIIVYDDYMNKNEEKIAEYIDIKDKLSNNIKYKLLLVDNDKITKLEESKKKISEIINEEIIKFM